MYVRLDISAHYLDKKGPAAEPTTGQLSVGAIKIGKAPS